MSMMMMKKVSDDDGYWLSCDESYPVMKGMIVKEVMKGDVSPVAMFIYFFYLVCCLEYAIMDVRGKAQAGVQPGEVEIETGGKEDVQSNLRKIKRRSEQSGLYVLFHFCDIKTSKDSQQPGDKTR